MPQHRAAGAVGKNGNGKRKKEVAEGERKPSPGTPTDTTWSTGTTDGTREDGRMHSYTFRGFVWGLEGKEVTIPPRSSWLKPAVPV